ncbi:citrate synthase [Peptoniphilus sp. KCTC 25270]|uniref:citrate synthase n=1 Tax=Peptoniphilus sp. KCTC 25270 TaxID=2897414 RepID=UPI001E369905|nr:citrate synthase [Peptoniphilus sp. KCTC 25270]MCD1146697.1 citrate synthase [Peptoniphilus sp. KCTC 25270]
MNNTDARLREFSQKIIERNSIKKDLYDKYDIRHGLRNSDDTGVLVGITRVGYVSGYDKVDGKKVPAPGDLMYRGYSVADLVHDFQETGRLGYEEVAFLLLFGSLPTKEELSFFQNLLIEAREFPKGYIEDVILKIPGKNIMNKMMRSMLTLYSYDENPENTDTENVLRQSIDLIAKMPIIMSYAYQAKRHYIDGESLVIHYPDKNKCIAPNILHLIRPSSQYTEEEAKLLDLMLILHAEHGGGNNSTFATHVVSSSGTDTYSAIVTGLGSLKGPRHGGANLMVSSMLEDLSSNIRNLHHEGDIEDYLRRILACDAFDNKGLIYGLGHAVYTLNDPRKDMLKEQARTLAEEKGYGDQYHFLELVEEIGGRLLQEKRGIDYPVCGNIDLYSGLVYEMLGVPKDLYTPLFAVSRMAGWCAHRLEQIQDKRIIRPGYVHLNSHKKYQKLENRCK